MDIVNICKIIYVKENFMNRKAKIIKMGISE